MKAFGLTDIGCVRNENQDTFLMKQENDRLFALVCDGMGGPNGGSIASRHTADLICDVITGNMTSLDIEEFKKAYTYSVTKANDQLMEIATKDDKYKGMGTTAVAAYIIQNKCVIANIGDSRAYHFTNDRIKQISHDHSMVQEFIDGGKLTVDEARNHPNKNIITRAIGAYDKVEPDFFDIELNNDSVILLCSDGLTNMLDDSEILFELDTASSVESCAGTLVEMAKERGGKDNITVLLIDMSKEA